MRYILTLILGVLLLFSGGNTAFSQEKLSDSVDNVVTGARDEHPVQDTASETVHASISPDDAKSLLEHQIQIFPNPVTHASQLSIRGLQPGDIIKIRNASGKEVFAAGLHFSIETLHLDTHALSPGSYDLLVARGMTFVKINFEIIR